MSETRPPPEAAPATVREALEEPDWGSLCVRGRLSLFGHDAVEADLLVIPRSAAWRLGRTARVSGGFLLLTPVVGIVPPHAPWIAAALMGAVIMGRRRWTERYSVAAFKAPCPRCGHELALGPGTRLRTPHPISCDGCGHESLLSAALPD
ncbi:MAG: hypothetical protein OEO23_00795 [Gemmatimonadota bacterium]|nr:hypothetical protein [Gemmatimonadota bacterium]